MNSASLPLPLKEKETVALTHEPKEFCNIVLPVVVAPPRNQRTPVSFMRFLGLYTGCACKVWKKVRPLAAEEVQSEAFYPMT